MEVNPYAASTVEAEVVETADEVVRFHDYGARPVIRSGGRLTPTQIHRGFKLILPWNVQRTIFALLAVVLAGMAVHLFVQHGATFQAFVVCFFAVLVGYIQLRFISRHVQATLRDPNGLWRYHEGIYGEDYCDACGPVSAGRFAWDAFKGWREKRGVVALIMHRVGFGLITAREFFASEEDWQAFLDLLDRKLTRL